MKERYLELIEKGNKKSGGKQLWTYYDKMHSILGEEDTITLEHIQEVGSCHGVKKRKMEIAVVSPRDRKVGFQMLNRWND
jgi:hypothetical protein